MKRSLLAALVALTALFASAAEHSSHGSAAKEPVADAVTANYPLKTCVVSDEDLGSMGKPFAVIHKQSELFVGRAGFGDIEGGEIDVLTNITDNNTANLMPFLIPTRSGKKQVQPDKQCIHPRTRALFYVVI